MKDKIYSSFYEHLELIRKRPSVTIGRKSIIFLNVYLLGYEAYAKIHSISNAYPEQPSFYYFSEFVKKKYNEELSTLNWAYILYYNLEEDEERAFDKCFELLDEYKRAFIE